MAYSHNYGYTSTNSSAFSDSWITIANSIIRAVTSLLAIFRDAFDWRPSPLEHLQAADAGRVLRADPKGRNRRYRSFRMRALLHLLFSGDGFTEPQATGAS